MQGITLDLEKRDVLGKRVKDLRQQGMIPAVIHDHGRDSIIVSAEYQAAHKAYSQAGRHHPVSLSVGGKKYTAIIKNVTHDPRHNSISHIVFNAVKANQKIVADIPVQMRLPEGDELAPAERTGLMILHNATTIQVEAPANKLPDALYFDGEKLAEVGDHVTVADLEIPEGITLKADESQTVASVFEPSAVVAEEAEEAAEGEAAAEGEQAVTEGEQPAAEKSEEK